MTIKEILKKYDNKAIESCPRGTGELLEMGHC